MVISSIPFFSSPQLHLKHTLMGLSSQCSHSSIAKLSMAHLTSWVCRQKFWKLYFVIVLVIFFPVMCCIVTISGFHVGMRRCKVESLPTTGRYRRPRLSDRSCTCICFSLLSLNPAISYCPQAFRFCCLCRCIECDTDCQSRRLSLALDSPMTVRSTAFPFCCLNRCDPVVCYDLIFAAYMRGYWWWELCDMTSRLFLTGLLGFVPASAQCSVGIAVWSGPFTLLGLFFDPFPVLRLKRFACSASVS